jgi:hypothetical protein
MDTIKIILTFLTISNSLYAIGIITCVSRFYNYYFKNATFSGNTSETLESIVHYICIAIIYFPIHFGVEFLIG